MEEYMSQLKTFDKLLNDRLNAKEKEFNINEVPDWN